MQVNCQERVGAFCFPVHPVLPTLAFSEPAATVGSRTDREDEMAFNRLRPRVGAGFYRLALPPCDLAGGDLLRNPGVLLVCSSVTLVACRHDWPIQLNGEYSVAPSGAAALADGAVVVAGANAGALTLCGASAGKLGLESGFLLSLSGNGQCNWVARRRTTSGASAVAATGRGSDEIFWAGNECNGCDIRRSFVERVDKAGRALWTFTLSGAHVGVTSLAMAPIGPVVAGTFVGSVDVEPQTLTSHGPQEPDSFLVQLDSSGDAVWLSQFGGDGRDVVTGVAALANGQVVATGEIAPNTPCERPPGPPPTTDAFVARFDQGRQVSCKTIRTSSSSGPAGSAVRGTAIAGDSSGNVAVAGTYRGSFRLGDRELAWTAQREAQDAWPDPFLLVYDAKGVPLWARRIELPFGKPVAIAFDQGDVVVAVERPPVVVRFDPSGATRWTHAFPDPHLSLESLSISACGTVVVLGDTAVGNQGAPRQAGFLSLLSRQGTLEVRTCRP